MTGYGAIHNVAVVLSGDSVGVFGYGAVGLNVVKSAQLAGASQVIGIDPTLSRRQRALSFRATHVFTLEEALNVIRELTEVEELIT